MTSYEGSAQLSGPRPALPERIIGHIDVVTALIKRDVQSRFGENALGYGWTYVTPLVWVAATYFAFMFFARTPPVFTDTVTFIISGLIPYAAFRYVITSIGRGMTTVRGLLIFPSVKHEHAIATAALVEFANMFVVFAVVAAVNYLVFGNFELNSPVHFLGGVSLAWGLGVAYGYLFAMLGRINPTFTQVGVVLLRPAFFVSGIFFTANELPDTLLNVLWWNPLLHAVEIARDGMLFHYDSRVASPLYVVLWIGGLFAAGFAANFVRRT